MKFFQHTQYAIRIGGKRRFISAFRKGRQKLGFEYFDSKNYPSWADIPRTRWINIFWGSTKVHRWWALDLYIHF